MAKWMDAAMIERHGKQASSSPVFPRLFAVNAKYDSTAHMKFI
jgi:hypothetical protein